MIDTLKVQLIELEGMRDACHDQCVILLDEYKFALAPDVDKAFAVYRSEVRRLFALAKAARNLKKAIKTLQKL